MSSGPLHLVAVAGLIALAVVPLSNVAGAAKRPARELLPDLAQDAPSQISVQQVAGPRGTEFRLGFRSAVRNIGRGRLIVEGTRRTSKGQLRADQLVELSNGRLRRYRGVLRMRYAYTPTHNHFHVLRFDRYSLRDARTGVAVRPDHKSGFCLGDRQEVKRPRVHPPAYYGQLTGECERGRPDSLRVVEGLTPGYLDDYGPQLEGQYIDITGVPAGEYSLVHQVNADRRIRERNSRNDVASALVRIEWPGGSQQPPTVTVLGTCTKLVICTDTTAARSTIKPAVPVLTAAETARLQLWCSLVDPVGPLNPSATRARLARIAESQRAWQSAVSRAAHR